MHHRYRNLIRRSFLLAIFLGMVVAAQAQTADTAKWYVGGPWEKELFSTDIAAIRSAAQANQYPTPQAVTIFMSQGQAIFHADGSLERHSALIYRIENDDGVRNWSDTEISYSTWHQDPPKLRVRIINPDGKILNVSEKDLLEVSAGDGEDQLYTDRKTLKAPYPNVVVGSIIEEEIITFSRPYLENTGLEDQWYFARKTSVGLNRYSISYPVGATVQLKTASLDNIVPTKSVQDSNNLISWEFRNQAPGQDREEFTPPENRQRPVITVGSASSWTVIAERYAQEVEKVLATNPLRIPPELNLPRNDAKAATLAASLWLNSKVRYTGLELGQNSIVPFPPQKTIDRGYGDCKDKASLLVALLRSAGYKAWVSLILTGPGWDIDPTICGMTNFNHAIVYVDASGGFWFDPTVEINRDTTLPYHDQYRYTLIARPGQKELSRTPAAPAGDNLIRESRDLVLADSGKGSVTETTEYFGAYDTYYRNMQPYRDPKKAKELLESYADSYYGTKKVNTTSWANPRDLSKPFSVTLAASDINRAISGDTSAEVSLTLNNLRSLFNENLLDPKDPKRTQPYRFNLPFSYELVSDIKVPAGFQPRTVPQNVEVANTEFLFRRTWEPQADGNLRGIIRFETRKLEYSPTEFVSLRKDLQKLFEDYGVLTVNFDHQGEALRAEGRYAEAFDVYRKLLADNPNSAIQNKRLSVALLSYSLGQPAVFYAKRATELDPKNADMWANLANMLMTDGLGRRLNKGYDRVGAIAAWKKAIELEPDNKAHQANLAILYEYNPNGERYQDSDDLKLARSEYLGLGKAIDEYSLQINLWNVQIRLNDIAAAKLLLPDIKDEQQRNIAMAVTEVLAGNQAAPAKLMEQNLSLEKRQSYLVGAAENLVSLRHYSDAARLLRQAAIANKDAASIENRADMLDRITNHDSAGIDSSTPIGILKNFFFDYINRNPTSSNSAIYQKYFAKSFLDCIDDLGEKRLNGYLDTLISPAVGAGSARLLSDITLSLLSFETAGDDAHGYRLIAGFEGASSNTFQFFLVREMGKYRIVGWEPLYPVLGKQIVSYLDAGNLEAAVRWFDWVFPPAKAQNSSVLNIGFFTNERIVRKPWIMRLAAEALALTDKSKGKARAGVTALWQKISDHAAFLREATAQGIPPDLQQDAWNALAFSLANTASRNMVFDSAATISAALATYLPGDRQFIPWYATNKALWGQDKEAEAIMEGLRDSKPDDRAVFSQLLEIYQMTQNFAKIDAESAKYPTRLGASELNSLAWAELFRNPASRNLAPSALERARKSVNLSQGKERSILHTLATVYATVGRYDEARSVLAKVIELNPGREPSADDWYVIGLIADGYGFHEAAVEAWKKVTRPDEAIPQKTDTYVLAQAHLK